MTFPFQYKDEAESAAYIPVHGASAWASQAPERAQTETQGQETGKPGHAAGLGRSDVLDILSVN